MLKVRDGYALTNGRLAYFVTHLDAVQVLGAYRAVRGSELGAIHTDRVRTRTRDV